MKKQVLMALIWGLVLGALAAQDTFQLAPPYLRYNSVFFEKEARVSMEFDQAGTQIHYTLSGFEPTENDPVYKKPLRLKKEWNMLKAKTFGNGFRPSETVKVTFYQRKNIIKSIQITPPNTRYPGEGPNTLIDGKGGKMNLNSTTWMGFDQDTVTVVLTLDKPRMVLRGMIHVLEHQGAWVFPPTWIETCFWDEDAKDWGVPYDQPNRMVEPDTRIAGKSLWLSFFESGKRAQKIRIKLVSLESMPDWHPGKGKRAWIFIDEIMLY
jgi:hypothetical protein